jgi:hypothetical protein
LPRKRPYRQLAKMQSMQKEIEESLIEIKNGEMTNFDRIVGVDTFEDFAQHYRQLVLKDLNVTQKKQFIQKFLKNIEVGVKTYKVHYNVDSEHYRRELALREAGSRPFSGRLKLFTNYGSNTLTIGAPART